MPRNEVRIYHSRRPLKTALTVLLVLLLVLLVLAVAVFFGFKRYIVYTSDGVHLEVPWLGYPEAPETEDADDSPAIPDTPEDAGLPDTGGAP